MANTKFDAKSFNPEAFKYKADRIPRTRLNEIRKSRVLVGNPDIREVFASQNGTGYARIAMRGLLDGDAVNYDGKTDITATSTKTFEQGVVVIGRAKAWVEKDFSYDITGGVDFMDNVAQQVAEYWQDVDQDMDCQHFFRQIFLGYFSDIVQAFDTLRKNVCGDDYTSLHNPIVLSSVLPAYGMFHSIQILFL